MTASRTVVIVGGGTGGLVAARRLRRTLRAVDRVVLVERDPIFQFAPSFLWLLSGHRRPDQLRRDIRGLRRRGVEVVDAPAEHLDLERRRVRTAAGELPYDRLVVAVGADLAPAAMPGFAEGAHTFYTSTDAVEAGQALRQLDRGRLVVLISALPFKCPAAPYEAAFLAAAQLRGRGVRSQVTIDLYTPEPAPMPSAGPSVGTALRGLLADHGIALHTERPAERIDPAGRELVLADGERVGYDLLLGVPPHRPPELVPASGLADAAGFVSVDRATLETAVPGVFAIGDVTAIPIAGGKWLPKAGVFAHAEAVAVARRITAELRGRAPAATFAGRGGCFVEVGDGAAAYGAGDFYAAGGAEVRLRGPGRRWHLGKVAVEQAWLRRLP